ncbi:MAG: hypothetical protein ABI193_03945, partial [Minicystis sp.]
LKAFNLALLYAAVLDPRLPAGVVPGLEEDLETLGVVVPGAQQARHESQSATVTQDARGRKGHALVRSVRTAVRKAKATPEVKKAFGVGQLLRPLVVTDVIAGLQQIIDRASADPAEAASVGILPKDLAAMVVARDALAGADKAQEQKRASAPLSTKERNRTGNRVLLAVSRISGAGILEFAGSPEVLASFEALKPPRRGPKDGISGKVKNGKVGIPDDGKVGNPGDGAKGQSPPLNG